MQRHTILIPPTFKLRDHGWLGRLAAIGKLLCFLSLGSNQNNRHRFDQDFADIKALQDFFECNRPSLHARAHRRAVRRVHRRFLVVVSVGIATDIEVVIVFGDFF
jgi:hypothetical protein